MRPYYLFIATLVSLPGCANFEWPWESWGPEPAIDPVVDTGEEDDVLIGDTGESYDPVATRIELAQSAIMLTQVGEQRQVSATVYDQHDVPMEGVEVSWVSMDEDEVTVDSDGLVTAMEPLGSAQLFAETEDLSTPPMLVLITDPVDGAVLVDDSAVVEMGVVDETASWGLGVQYTAILDGAGTVAVDDIVLGTGALPLAGRVVSTAEVSTGVEVTLEVVGVEELFDDLEVEESFSMELLEPEFDDEVLEVFEVSEDSDGSLVFTPHETAEGAKSLQGVFAEVFDCSDSGVSAPLISGLSPQIKIGRQVSIVMEADGFNLHTMYVVGDLATEVSVKSGLAAAFEGKITCDATLAEYPLPAGPLGVVFGPKVGVGAGFSFSGKMTLAELAVEAKMTGSSHMELGWETPEGESTQAVTESTNDYKADFSVTLPSADMQQAQVELKGEVYGFAKLSFGPQIPWLPRSVLATLKIDTLGTKLGVGDSLVLAMPFAQALDPTKASEGQVYLFIWAGVQDGVFQDAFDLLGISLASFSVEVQEVLWRTPTGTLTVDDSSLEGSSTVLVTVELDRENLNSSEGYQVEEVIIYAMDEDADIPWEALTELVRLSPESTGEYIFEYEWTPSATEAEGAPTLVAFTSTSSTLVPVPLEIAKDSRVSTTFCTPEFEADVVLSTSMGGASMTTVAEESGTINNDGYISFIGENSDSDERVWVLTSWGGADSVAYVGREYVGGAPMNNNDPAEIYVGEYLPDTDLDGDGVFEYDETWTARLWTTGDVGTELGNSTEEDDEPADFSTVSGVHGDLNDEGAVVFLAEVEGSDTLMYWDGAGLSNLSTAGEHPRISNSGLIVYMDGSSVEAYGVGSLGSSSGGANVSADGDFVAWADDTEVYLWNGSEDFKMSDLLGTSDAIGSVSSGNIVGVGYEAGTCGGIGTVGFVGQDTDGTEAFFALQMTDLDTGRPGVSNLRPIVKVGDTVGSHTVTAMSTYNPVSDDGSWLVVRAEFDDDSTGFIRMQATD